MLEEHHGKATHQRIVQAVVDTVSTSWVGNVTEWARQDIAHGFKRQTLEGTHGLSLLLWE